MPSRLRRWQSSSSLSLSSSSLSSSSSSGIGQSRTTRNPPRQSNAGRRWLPHLWIYSFRYLFDAAVCSCIQFPNLQLLLADSNRPYSTLRSLVEGTIFSQLLGNCSSLESKIG